MLPNDKRMLPNGKQMRPNDEQMLPNDEQMLSNDEQMLPNDRTLFDRRVLFDFQFQKFQRNAHPIERQRSECQGVIVLPRRGLLVAGRRNHTLACEVARRGRIFVFLIAQNLHPIAPRRLKCNVFWGWRGISLTTHTRTLCRVQLRR